MKSRQAFWRRREEFLRLAVTKDLAMLRAKYHRQVPSYVTASDLAACIELHGLMEMLISESFAKIIAGGHSWQVV